MEDDDLVEALKNMNRDAVVGSFVGVVKAVNEEERTVEVQADDETFFDVKLQAVVKAFEKEILIVPTLESPVLCISEGNSKERFVVIKYSEIDSLLVKIEKQSITMNAEGFKLDSEGQILDITKDGFVFNGGENKGLIKIEELTKNLDKLTARVDTIFDGLSKLSPDPPQAGSASVTTGLKAIVSPAKEDFTGLENELVKH